MIMKIYKFLFQGNFYLRLFTKGMLLHCITLSTILSFIETLFTSYWLKLSCCTTYDIAESTILTFFLYGDVQIYFCVSMFSQLITNLNIKWLKNTWTISISDNSFGAHQKRRFHNDFLHPSLPYHILAVRKN